MRKHVVILLTALALLLAGTGAAAAVLMHQQLPVSYGVQAEQGDPSAADGYVVYGDYKLMDHPCWYSSYRFGQPEPAESSFRFHSEPMRFEPMRGEVPLGVDLACGLPIGTVSLEEIREKWKGVTMPGLLSAYEQLAEQTPEGTVGRKSVKLFQLMDCYPVFYDIRLPDRLWDGYDPSEWLFRLEKEGAQQMQNYFQIPVLPEETYELVVDHRQIGGAWIEEPSESNQERYRLQSVGTVLEDTAYFLIDAHTNKGNLVDTSRIPGGYGLYAISADREKMNVDFDSLTTCMALDPDYVPVELVAEPETGHLLYYAQKENDLYLLVLEPKEGRILQEICIQKGENCYQWHRTDGTEIYCVSSGKYIDVYRRDGEGLYQPALHAPLTGDMFDYDHMTQMDFAFHGDSMGIAEGWDRDETGTQGSYGFRLTVLTAQGLAYRGSYLTQLQADRGNPYTSTDILERIRVSIE